MVGAVANGRKTPTEQPELRAAAPHRGGPLGSSGAAPDAAPATEPRRTDMTAAATPEPAAASTPQAAKSDKSETKTEVVPPTGEQAEGKT